MVIVLSKTKNATVRISHTEYQEFQAWKRGIEIETPTARDRRVFEEAMKEIENGEYITLKDFKNELVRSRSKKG